jgi:hypothetical protein
MTSLERQLLAVAALLNVPLLLLFGAPAEVRDLFLSVVPLTIATARFFSVADRNSVMAADKAAVGH